MAQQRTVVLAEHDVPSQLAEARLQDDRKLDVRQRITELEQARAWMREFRALQDACRQELVVRGEERAGAVERADALGRERPELPEAVVDTVEGRQDVEPAERRIAWRQLGERVGGRQDPEVDPARRRTNE